MKTVRRSGPFSVAVAFALLVVATAGRSMAESGYDAWLRYSPVTEDVAKTYRWLPEQIVLLKDGVVAKSAAEELARGLKGLLNKRLSRRAKLDSAPAIVLTTRSALEHVKPKWNADF